MAERGLLARTSLSAFRAWLAERGWREQPTKGDYEVARFTHAEHVPLIIFARQTATMHVTVQEKDWALVRRFLRSIHDVNGSSPDAKVMHEARRRARTQ